MEVHETIFDGVLLIVPHSIDENSVQEKILYDKNEFEKLIGYHNFVQDNESYSHYGVIRAFHYQVPPFSQSKLLWVSRGHILDVVVDIRKGSPTFGKAATFNLSDKNQHMLYIPRGFAHGFSALTDNVIFQFKCDNYYNKECERSIAWNDPDLKVDWGIPEEYIVVSTKDCNQQLLCNTISPFSY